MLDRRKFIKDSCSACVGILAIGSVASLLSSCASLPVYKTTVQDNLIRVPLETILPEEKMKIIRSKSLTYDILLILGENKKHKAFLMVCTHQDNILVANNKGLTCNLHGSRFNLEGKVQNGPATRDLNPLRIEEDEKNINIWVTA